MIRLILYVVLNYVFNYVFNIQLIFNIQRVIQYSTSINIHLFILYSILNSPIQLSIQQFQPFIQHSTLIFKTFNYSLDCLQSTFSLKIRLVLDLIPRDCRPRCYYIGTETRREKTDCWLFSSKQTLRQPRNGVTDWNRTNRIPSMLQI